MSNKSCKWGSGGIRTHINQFRATTDYQDAKHCHYATLPYQCGFKG